MITCDFAYNPPDIIMTRNELKQLIKESYQEIVSEVNVADAATKSLINEFGQLTAELSREKLRLKELEARHGEMEKQVREMLEALTVVEDKTLVTEQYIAEIVRKGYDRSNTRYKEAFELALTKVNEATRNVLKEAVEATKSVTKVPASIGIKNISEDHGNTEQHIAGIKSALGSLDLANNVLAKLAHSSMEESNGSVPNHPSPFEPLSEVAKGGKPAVNPTKKGMFDGKTEAELKKMKADLEKQNDVLKKAGKQIPHQNRTKMAQLNSALNAKSKSGIAKKKDKK